MVIRNLSGLRILHRILKKYYICHISSGIQHYLYQYDSNADRLECVPVSSPGPRHQKRNHPVWYQMPHMSHMSYFHSFSQKLFHPTHKEPPKIGAAVSGHVLQHLRHAVSVRSSCHSYSCKGQQLGQNGFGALGGHATSNPIMTISFLLIWFLWMRVFCIYHILYTQCSCLGGWTVSGKLPQDA